MRNFGELIWNYPILKPLILFCLDQINCELEQKYYWVCFMSHVPPDVLPGFATFVRVLDRWLNDW